MTTTKTTTKIEKNDSSISLVIANATSYRACLIAAHRAVADVLAMTAGSDRDMPAIYVDNSYRPAISMKRGCGYYAVVTIEFVDARCGESWKASRIRQEREAVKAFEIATSKF